MLLLHSEVKFKASAALLVGMGGVCFFLCGVLTSFSTGQTCVYRIVLNFDNTINTKSLTTWNESSWFLLAEGKIQSVVVLGRRFAWTGTAWERENTHSLIV